MIRRQTGGKVFSEPILIISIDLRLTNEDSLGIPVVAQEINSVQVFFSIWTQMEVVLMTGVILAQVRGTFVLKSL